MYTANNLSYSLSNKLITSNYLRDLSLYLPHKYFCRNNSKKLFFFFTFFLSLQFFINLIRSTFVCITLLPSYINENRVLLVTYEYDTNLVVWSSYEIIRRKKKNWYHGC